MSAVRPDVMDRFARCEEGGCPFDDGFLDMGADAPPAGGIVIPC